MESKTKQEVIKMLRGVVDNILYSSSPAARETMVALRETLSLLESASSQEPELPQFKPGDIVRVWNGKVARVIAQGESDIFSPFVIWEEGRESPTPGWTYAKNLTLLILAGPQELDGVREGDIVEKQNGIVCRVLAVQQTPGYPYNPYCVRSSGGLTWCNREDIKRILTFGETKP